MRKVLFLILVVTGSVRLQAQDYSAIHGSTHFGSLGVYNNPSSIVTSPYKWDLTVLGIQYQSITNAVKGPNFPLILSPASTFFASNGNFPRVADFNFNLHLLNGRVSLNQDRAFAFGLNLRNYVIATTSRINYTDSVLGPRSFLFLNQANTGIEANVTTSSWMEVYGTYAATLRDNEVSRLTGGATLKVMRSMAGAYAKVNNVSVIREQRPTDDVIYKIAEGDAKYGYSDNLGDGESISAGDIAGGSKTGIAFDLGIEYIVKTQAVSGFGDEVLANEYEWKIGVSLLDLGSNNFKYSAGSRSVSTLREDISSTTLTQKFSTVKNVRSFNDSLSTIVDRYDTLSGKFRINNPSRLVVNVDRYLTGNFYVNADLSVNLVSANGSGIAVNSAKLLTVTPRWEKRRFGVFVPLQYTKHGNFWFGAAVKAGPLLLGTHNLLNAFSKNKNISGGAYIALIIRPQNFFANPRNQQYECPEY